MTDQSAALGPRRKLEREFITSEGIDLRLTLGSAGERAGAYILDIIAISVIGFVALLVAGMTGLMGGGDSEFVTVVELLFLFILRNGYFVGFELGTRAATPGKRLMRLRVISRDGGRLKGEAIVARNAMRELETGLPFNLLILTWVQSMLGLPGGMLTLVGLGWASVFLFFPLFNRDRLRVGDLVAGTWVVQLPRRQLGRSVVERREVPRFVFTDAQLGAYGEFELQKLEEVLRREEELAVIVVARTIRTRIGWTGDDSEDLEFLRAYYAALCERLERNMLFGKRRRNKYEKA